VPATGLAPPELKEVHPLGKSPVITDADLTVAESGAIVDYLIGTYDAEGKILGSHGVLATVQGKLKNTFWSHYAEGSLMPLLVMLLVFNGIDTKSPFVIRFIAKAITKSVRVAYTDPNLIDAFNFIEAHLSTSGSYFLGENLTASDFMMAFPLEAALSRCGPMMGPFTKAYVERVHSRPAYRRTLEKGGQYAYAK